MTRSARQVAEPARTPAGLDHLLQQSSRTFALTIPLLSEPTRCAVTVAYLLFRVADTLEDSHRFGRARKLDELERLESLLRRPTVDGADLLARRWLADPPHDHAGYRELLAEFPRVLEAAERLEPTTRERVMAHTMRTVAGMASFVARERDGELRLVDVADLRAYCYAVAGIVGEMLTELFVEAEPRLAEAATELHGDAATFGEALQLVNILKDSADDASEGRHYLPPGVAREEILALAREDLATAAGYCSRLASAGADRGLLAFTALPVMLARATLDRVERDGPGAKLTRPEVAAIVGRLHDALERNDVTALLEDRS